MKPILALLACLTLSGCANLIPYVQQHAAGIAAFTAVATAISAGESAVANAIEIKNELKDKK